MEAGNSLIFLISSLKLIDVIGYAYFFYFYFWHHLIKFIIDFI